jgi:predicted permease
MIIMSRARSALHNLFRRAEADRDLDDEVRGYIELLVAEKMRTGMDASAARRAALVEIGGVERVKENVRAVRAGALIDALQQDVRYAVRGLRRNPAFSAVALTCIATAVAATTLIFSAVNGILLRPLSYDDAGGLVVLQSTNAARDVRRGPVSWGDVTSWSEQSRTIADLGVWGPVAAEFVDAERHAERHAERASGGAASSGVLRALRVTPIAGRLFEPNDQKFGNHRVLILGDAMWKRWFGGDTGVIGRTVTVAMRPAPPQPYRVIGIVPSANGLPDGAEFWIPQQFDDDEYTTHEARRYDGAIGRLRPGVSLRVARAELATISRRLQAAFPAADEGWETEVRTLHETLTASYRKPVLLFQGAAGLLLIIACANVANLMLARGVARRREMGLRLTLGGTRGRLMRQMITESTVLALTGGFGGALASIAGTRMLPLAFPDGVPSYLDLSVDARVIAFATAISLLAGVVFGSMPAFRASDVAPADALRGGPREGTALASIRVRNVLACLEIALSLVLLVGATLLLQTNLAITSELGFESHGTLAVSVPTPPQRYEGSPRETFYSQLSAEIRALPHVQRVGFAPAQAPLSRRGPLSRSRIVITAAQADTSSDKNKAIVHEVGLSYFAALGAPIVAGRAFNATDARADDHAGSFAAIVNETFARTFFGTDAPVGQRVRATVPGAQSMGTPEFVVVGVVRDFREERPPARIAPALYPYLPFGISSQTLVVHTDLRHPSDVVPQINAIVRRLDPALPAPMVESFDRVLARGLWRERLHERVLSVFACLAVILALIGVYGVVAYSVAQRTAEFGMRMALGATRASLMTLVVRHGLRLAVIGVTLGVAGSLATTRLLSGVLYGIEPSDPATIAIASVTVVLISVLAVVVPALRAARVDPMTALRAE